MKIIIFLKETFFKSVLITVSLCEFKKLKQVKLILLIVVLLNSCRPARVYTTASYGSIKSYTEKQHYIDAKGSSLNLR